MKNRLKLLRSSLEMTMDEFGKKLGVTRAAVSNLENGHRELTNQMITSICREFNVNEDWLRNGAGEMFVKRTRNQQVADFVNDIMEEEDSSFRKRFIEALSKLTVYDWQVLEQIAKNLVSKEEEG